MASAMSVMMVVVSLLKVSTGVRLLKDSVIPNHALRGQKAVLRCNYDLEGDNLYSVKWYYNQKEFYRFIPSDNPKVTIFNHHPGVNVNPHLSTERELVLDNVDFTTSGTFRCEVSGDAPMFQTASTEGIMAVVALPRGGPEIEGGHPRYNMGDRVNVTCVSRNSLPAAQLSWYINGEKADKQFVLYYPEEESYSGLRSAKLGLSFKVRHKHFKDGDLKLKCTATISTVYWKSNEESVQGSGFNAHTSSSSSAAQPVSENRGRTSAATSHVSGSIGGGGGSSGIGVMGSGSAVLISSTATLVAAALVAIQNLRERRQLQ